MVISREARERKYKAQRYTETAANVAVVGFHVGGVSRHLEAVPTLPSLAVAWSLNIEAMIYNVLMGLRQNPTRHLHHSTLALQTAQQG